jgi:hypothetical protein
MARPRKEDNADSTPNPDMRQFREDVGKTVKCITDRRPWVDVIGEKETRPLKMGEVVQVDIPQAKNLVRHGFVTLWDKDMED